MTEPLVSTLARKFRLDVNTGTSIAPVWTQVRGIGEFKDNVDPSTEDDTDYDSDGWGSDVKVLLKWKIEGKVARKVGRDSGSYDPGQEALRLASRQFGPAAVVEVRWYDREGGPEAYQGLADVTWSNDGGAAAARATASFTLMGKGAPTTITNPAA